MLTGWTWLRRKGRLPSFLILPSCFARMVFQPLLKFILNLTDSNKFSQAKHYSVIQQSTRIISNLRKIKNQVGGVLFCVSLNAIGTSTRCRGRQRFQDRWCDATLMFFTIPQNTSSNLFNQISNPHLISYDNFQNSTKSSPRGVLFISLSSFQKSNQRCSCAKIVSLYQITTTFHSMIAEMVKFLNLQRSVKNRIATSSPVCVFYQKLLRKQ